MAYENNNVRAGANGAGVYIGNTEIMGGGWDGILSSLINVAPDYPYANDADNIFMLNIINLTDLEITLTRAGADTIIPPYHIEWYSIAKGSDVSIQPNANVTFVKCDVTSDFFDINSERTGGVVISNFAAIYNFNVITYVIMK